MPISRIRLCFSLETSPEVDFQSANFYINNFVFDSLKCGYMSKPLFTFTYCTRIYFA